MHPYVSFSYGVFGPLAERSRAQTADLQKRLHRAHMPYRAAAYLSALYMTGVLVAFPGLALGAALVLAGAALLASYLSARRASAVSPIEVLAAE